MRISVLRGGSWNNKPNNLRSANRNRNDPSKQNNNIGFRCAQYPGLPDFGHSRMTGVCRLGVHGVPFLCKTFLGLAKHKTGILPASRVTENRKGLSFPFVRKDWR